MKQEYFVVVLAHSLRGRLRRIHIPHQAVYAILAFALLGCFSLFGFVASYARMAWKVANYNALRREADTLRSRYQSLEHLVSQKNDQLASLQLYAKEVTIAFGIKQKLEGPADIMAEGKLVPSYSESIEDYDFLRKASMIGIGSKASWRSRLSRPNLWPVEGRLILSSYGQRLDPFSGEGAFHKGVDISAPSGMPVRAAADGIVVHAEFASGGYGRLVVIDHGGGIQTYYAHLSKFYVKAGQEVRAGETVGAVGSSGRVTAPHLHYEVRLGGAPVNPYNYLAKAKVFQAIPEQKDFRFLGSTN
jgi:murein DD-endopeptidase MepM/ murein hydrolase activator NlpD